MLEPYRQLWQRPRSARDPAMRMPPASTAVVGLCRAAWTRRPFEAAVALTAVLANFMPILLSVIPFQATQTWTAHVVCGWLAVAVLALMLAVLAWSLFLVRRPQLPVEPATLAAAMYYLCDSAMLCDFEGLSTLGQRDRARYLEKMDQTYRFGTIAGDGSGQKRTAVDYADQVI